MNKFSDFTKPYNVVTTLLAIISIALAVYFYRSTVPVAEVRFVSNKDVVAELDRPEFSLALNGKVIQSRTLHRSIIGIWNAGTVAFEPNVVRRALTIEFGSDDVIVDAQIFRQSHELIGPILKFSEKNIVVTWDHFDPNFYIVVRAYHYKDNSPRLSLRSIGDKEISNEIDSDIFKSAKFVWGALALLLGISVAGFGLAEFVEKMVSKMFGSRTVGFIGWILVALTIMAVISVGALSGRTPSVVRSALGMEIPSDLYQIMPIDRGQNN
jgi:hypothetical protein